MSRRFGARGHGLAGQRLDRTQEVAGSSPASSMTRGPRDGVDLETLALTLPLCGLPMPRRDDGGCRAPGRLDLRFGCELITGRREDIGRLARASRLRPDRLLRPRRGRLQPGGRQRTSSLRRAPKTRSTVPPWDSTVCFTIPSPSPPPGRERSARQKRSNTRAWSLGRDARSLVADGDRDPVAVACRGKQDPRAGRGMAHGVVEKIRDRALERIPSPTIMRRGSRRRAILTPRCSARASNSSPASAAISARSA